MVPVSWSKLSPHPRMHLTGEKLPGIDDLENQVVVEEDKDLVDQKTDLILRTGIQLDQQ